MPWAVEEREGQYCVVVSEGPKKGKTVHCHDSEEKAKAQMRALYANTEEKMPNASPFGKKKAPPFGKKTAAFSATERLERKLRR